MNGQLLFDFARKPIEPSAEADAAWELRAYAHALNFIESLPPGSPLTTEQVREYAEARGLPDPRDKRKWGSVLPKARTAGLIAKAGITYAKDPKVHFNIVTDWVRL